MSPPRLAHIRCGLFYWSLEFRTIPFCTFASRQTCYSSGLLGSVTFLAASSMALGLCPFLFSRSGRRPRVQLLPFVFEIPLYNLVHANMVGTSQKFVFRLSRTAVLYVIYHSVGGLRPNGRILTRNCFVLPHLFCDIVCDSSTIS
jgi:hypothetical protein